MPCRDSSNDWSNSRASMEGEMLKDILAALDRWPLWKRMGEAPERVDALEKRVAELEEKLGGKWPADVCPACGERAMRQKHALGPDAKGMMQRTWACEACGHNDKRLSKT
jgi:uncharacterized protein with PIN domain